MGLDLGHLASVYFAKKKIGYRQLVFAVAYVMTIANQALLRYVLIDEPDDLGLLLLLLLLLLLGVVW